MVSLGPLASRRFCSYACAFCYVHGGFARYPNLSTHEVLEYLQSRRSDYDIVYVSGDTDSFAPPRLSQGLELLEALASLECDLLFTTRAALPDDACERLGALARTLAGHRRLLVGCVSISRLRSAPHLEPPPIPTPARRAAVLHALRLNGLATILALRPFLPIIPIPEYLEIVNMCRNDVDVVLGEVWYADTDGLLEKQVFPDGVPPDIHFTRQEMDFDLTGRAWKVWQGNDVEAAVASFCDSLGLPFFMRSAPAIDLLRDAIQCQSPSRVH